MLPTGKLKVLWEWSEWVAWAINIVDCKSVIASMPQAGTRSYRVGVHPPDSGRLAGRLREQARSHKRAKAKEKAAYTFASHHSSGRALARLQLLILIHPPLREAEWRRSSGEWRAAPFDAVEHAACRCSEANRRAVSPDECRSEGTPSLGEGPDAGASVFCLLF